MFKTLSLATLGVFGAAATYAGNVAFVAPVSPVVVEETGSMGGSGLWLIPLLLIALVFFASRGTTTETCTSQCD